MSARLILASASPRRRALLAQMGVRFDVVASDVPETPAPGEPPAVFACRAAREKAAEVAHRCPDAFVLAADTVVVVDGEIFGKPADRDAARQMLGALSGRTHVVLTAVALADPAGRIDDLLVRSEVEFRALTAAEIDDYLATDEAYDKAGAYAVQGLAQRFVLQVRGSYSNVVGLPVDEVHALLRRRLPAGANAPHPTS